MGTLKILRNEGNRYECSHSPIIISPTIASPILVHADYCSSTNSSTDILRWPSIGCLLCLTGSRARSKTEEESDVVSGSFGRSVSITGNKIMIHSEEDSLTMEPQKGGNTKVRRRSGEGTIDYNKLRR